MFRFLCLVLLVGCSLTKREYIEQIAGQFYLNSDQNDMELNVLKEETSWFNDAVEVVCLKQYISENSIDIKSSTNLKSKSN